MKNSWLVLFRNPILIFVAATIFGCSAGVKVKTGAGGASGAGAGAGSAGSTGTGGGSAGAGGGSTGNTTGGVDANVSADAACAISTAGAEPVPLDLYVLMDSSKSMLETTSAGVSKWSAVSSAMGMFFGDTGSAGLGVGIKYFPDEQASAPATCTADTACGTFGPCDRRETCVGANGSTTQVTPLCLSNTDCGTQTCALIKDCGGGNYCASAGTGTCAANCNAFAGYCDKRDICDSTKYATPDVPIVTLPDTTNVLVPSLTNHTPDGYTPTGPALTGAISFAKQRLLSVPEHKIAVVLVTDGLPGGFIPGFPPAQCAPSDIAGVAGIAMSGATASSPVLTFVIGVFNPGIEATTAKTNLDMLATAGGTGNAVVIDISQDVTAALHAALTQAQTKAIACSYQIPAATHGNVDFGKVNVQFTSGTGAVSTIGHTTAKAACSAGGWYYDIDPSVGTPTKIIACDSTCATFQADGSSGHVDIVLGCMTIMIG